MSYSVTISSTDGKAAISGSHACRTEADVDEFVDVLKALKPFLPLPDRVEAINRQIRAIREGNDG